MRTRRITRLMAALGLSLVFAAAVAKAATFAQQPTETKVATTTPPIAPGSKAPETVPLMTEGRKHAIIAGLVGAIFLIVSGAAGRADKAGAAERFGPRSSKRGPRSR